MKFKISVFLLLLSGAPVLAQTRDGKALKSLVKKMSGAETAFDAVALDKLLTSDYIEIFPTGEFDSREKVLVFFKPQFKTFAEQIPVTTKAIDFSIRSDGKFAVVIARLNKGFYERRKAFAAVQYPSNACLPQGKESVKNRSGAMHGRSFVAPIEVKNLHKRI